MNNYNGIANDSLSGGGAYNDNNIGHEVNNFTNHNGVFYGFVQSNNNTIDIVKHYGCDDNEEYAKDVLVVWLVKKKYIVGYYQNAKVYKKLQNVPDELLSERRYSDYNIMAEKAVIIPREERTFRVDYPSRTNIWYGNDSTNDKVIEYINNYDTNRNNLLRSIDVFDAPLQTTEIEAVVKIRENQSIFRDRLIKKYKCKCCLCGVSSKEFLIASHIKPWSVSNDNERLSPDNGLLLCPNHDKLFDAGYISFDNEGKILISSLIGDIDRRFMNVHSDMCIKQEYITNELKYYMNYHRLNIYKN